MSGCPPVFFGSIFNVLLVTHKMGSPFETLHKVHKNERLLSALIIDILDCLFTILLVDNLQAFQRQEFINMVDTV